MRAGREVLMKVDDNILLTVGNLQRILDQQLKPHQFHIVYFFCILNNIINRLNTTYRLYYMNRESANMPLFI